MGRGQTENKRHIQKYGEIIRKGKVKVYKWIH